MQIFTNSPLKFHGPDGVRKLQPTDLGRRTRMGVARTGQRTRQYSAVVSVEGSWNMANYGWATAPKLYGYHVKAILVRPLMPGGDPSGGGPAEIRSLPPIHRFRRILWPERPGFYLDKCDRPAIPNDYVDFVSPRPPVGGDDTVACITQTICCKLLAPASRLFHTVIDALASLIDQLRAGLSGRTRLHPSKANSAVPRKPATRTRFMTSAVDRNCGYTCVRSSKPGAADDANRATAVGDR